MFVRDILKDVDYKLIQGEIDQKVDHISWNSKSVLANSLFVCVKGTRVDRHDFASQAVDAGAIVLIIEHEVDNIPQNICIIQVENSRLAMAKIASNFYSNPAEYQRIVGITGTNGKTSVTAYISEILEYQGYKTGIIGTLDNKNGKEKIKTEKINPTTPDAIELHASLREMLDNGVENVIMEVTSIALENKRVENIKFDIGVFTNLTLDHLDAHGTFENYKNAKIELFKKSKTGVLNIDDPSYSDFVNNSQCESLITYGIDNDADFKAENIIQTVEGVKFTLKFKSFKREIKINIPGRFSVYNALAAIAACYEYGLTLDQIIAGIEKIQGVRGRFEVVKSKSDLIVIVDYAHTPDGLENILSTIKVFANNKIILVFGCGGDRDTSKRPIMGEIAGKWTDFCFITSDNPRSEDPVKIIDDIEEGIKKTQGLYTKIIDRKEAIEKALNYAISGDIVVIAGKGHETYQILSDKTIHFDDREIVVDYFEELNNKGDLNKKQV